MRCMSLLFAPGHRSPGRRRTNLRHARHALIDGVAAYLGASRVVAASNDPALGQVVTPLGFGFISGADESGSIDTKAHRRYSSVSLAVAAAPLG